MNPALIAVVLNVHLAVSVCTQTVTQVSCTPNTPMINDVTFTLDQCSQGRCQARWDGTAHIMGESFSGYVIVSEQNSHYSVVAGMTSVPSLALQLGADGELTNSVQTQGAEVVVNNADGTTIYMTPFLDISPAGVPSGVQ
jgi:hypothetical protein